MEEAGNEVWSWWWPLAAVGGSAGIISVVGIIAYQQLNNPDVIAWRTNILRARYLREQLERRGFLAKVTEYPRRATALVDFHDPGLERELIKRGGPLDSEKVEYYTTWAGRGSIAFRDERTEGDVPVITMRKPGAAGWWRETLATPPRIEISEVHLHTYDGLPSTHLHIKGEGLTMSEIRELAGFIARARDVAKKFLTGDEMPF